jgi:glycosyltransferase involved in cell wall biosynthesis
VTVSLLHVDIEGGWGGSSRSLYELLRRIDRTRISPVVAYRQEGPARGWYRALDIPTYHVPDIVSYVPRSAKALKTFVATLPRIARLKHAIRMLATIAERHYCRAVHLNYEGLFLMAPGLRRATGLPMTTHVRAVHGECYLSRWLARSLSRQIEHAFFIGRVEEGRWMGNGGKPGEIMYNIARAPLPRQPFSEPREVIYLGNLQASKGVKRLFEIAHAMKAAGGPRVTFAIYGRTRSDPSYLDQLKSLSGSLDGWIEFRGHVSDIEPILARAFALVRPSENNDPWGRDVIEATTAGVPVLATGHNDEVIQPGRNGMLYDAFDAEAFARQLIDLHRDHALWQSWSQEGIKVGIEKFLGTQQVSHFTEVMEELACERRSRYF